MRRPITFLLLTCTCLLSCKDRIKERNEKIKAALVKKFSDNTNRTRFLYVDSVKLLNVDSMTAKSLALLERSFLQDRFDEANELQKLYGSYAEHEINTAREMYSYEYRTKYLNEAQEDIDKMNEYMAQMKGYTNLLDSQKNYIKSSDSVKLVCFLVKAQCFYRDLQKNHIDTLSRLVYDNGDIKDPQEL